jgi:hypothetical protein
MQLPAVVIMTLVAQSRAQNIKIKKFCENAQFTFDKCDLTEKPSQDFLTNNSKGNSGKVQNLLFEITQNVI